MTVFFLFCLYLVTYLVICCGYELPKVGKRMKSVDWLHFPKSSSWLGDFLFMYACPHMQRDFDLTNNEEFFFETAKENASYVDKCLTKILPGRDGGFGWHSPYVAQYSNGSTVALFRKPRNRLVSAFLFEGGMMIPPGHLLSVNETAQQEFFERTRKSPNPIITYANYEGIRSCQTKMVLGHNCGTEFPISDADLVEAKRRVEHEFAFIGLTEESPATARLFYAMYGENITEPKYKPYSKDYRGNTRVTKSTRNKLLETLQELDWEDPPEQALYQHVRKVFYRRCQQYRIPTIESYEHKARS